MKLAPPGKTGAHHLQGPHQGRRLPVALGAEAVAVGHQALHGKAGKLVEAGRSSKVSVKAPKPPASRKPRRPSLDAAPHHAGPRGAAHRGAVRAPDRKAPRTRRARRSTSASGTAPDCRASSPTPVAVHREAQAHLGLHLVALGDGHVAHVVAEAGHPQVLPVVPGAGRPRPTRRSAPRTCRSCQCPTTTLRGDSAAGSR